MSVHVLLNLIVKQVEDIKWEACQAFYLFLRKLYIFNTTGELMFDLILYVHSTIFQLCRTGLPGLNQY